MRDDEAAAARLLEALIRASGLTSAQVQERNLKMRGSLRAALAGNEDLSFHQIVETLHTLEVSPNLFFRSLYPYPAPGSEAARLKDQIREGLAAEPAAAALPGTPPTPEELEERIRTAITLALEEPGLEG
ncbi:MAG TPA: hypothetical protein VN783_00150 [Thermoanaerobaculia bacterium]|nr:hypothetical protein [Thermoanaerobaculia bacterium]